jgi:hypothetical protein
MVMRRNSCGKGFRARCSLALVAGWAAELFLLAAAAYGSPPSWSQFGRDPGHTGAAPVAGQPLAAILADIVYDPFAAAEIAEGGGSLFVHYAAPLVDGADIYVEFKSGEYVSCDPPGSSQPYPCGPDAWSTQVWSVRKFSWRSGALVEQWDFQSDWKPEPTGRWEPVFQPALSGGFLYVPGAGGTVHQVEKSTGHSVARLNPFSEVRASRFVAGGLAAAHDGSLIYNALELDLADPWARDAAGAWLVRIRPDGSITRADFDSLVPDAPLPTDACRLVFSSEELPWPPSPEAVPNSAPCGSQRPGLNAVPAVAPDGTIYTVSRAHFNDRYSYVLAVRPDLTPVWSASLRGILSDGCDVLIPAGSCRAGAALGVDPATNDRPAGRVLDSSTSSPVVLPDGTVLFGAYTRYNLGRGHLFRFGADGDVLATSDFGWDITPAVRRHGGTFSIVIKDNHYPVGSYCGDPNFCPYSSARYDLASLDPELQREWIFTNTTAQSCLREPGGAVVCVPVDEPGFEWCVNQPAIDADGVAYANSEDGWLYAIGPDGRQRQSIFLNLALGAAYTPVSIGPDGRIYAQNNGHLLVVGVPSVPREAPENGSASRGQPRSVERR